MQSQEFKTKQAVDSVKMCAPVEDIFEEEEEEEEFVDEAEYIIEDKTFTEEELEDIIADRIGNIVGRRKAKPPKQFDSGKIKEQTQWTIEEKNFIDNKLKTLYKAKEIHHTYSFDKNVNMWSKVPDFKRPFITGYCMYVKDTKLICVDFDIDKALSFKQRISTRNELIKKLLHMVRRPDLIMFDFSANGGFHVWLYNDIQEMVEVCKKDRAIDIIELPEEKFSIDLIVPISYNDKDPFGVVLPYSIIDSNAGHSEVALYRCYTMPKNNPERPYTYSMFAEDTAEWLNLPRTIDDFTDKFSIATDIKSIKSKPKATPKVTKKSVKVEPKEVKENAIDDAESELSVPPVVAPTSVKPEPVPEELPPVEDLDEVDEVTEKVSRGLDTMQPHIRTLPGYSQKQLLRMRPSRSIPVGSTPNALMFQVVLECLENIYVHGDLHASPYEHLSVLHIASALLAFVEGTSNNDTADRVTVEDVQDYWDDIGEALILSGNAAARWNSEFQRAVQSQENGQVYGSWTNIIDYVWYYNPEAYDGSLKNMVAKFKPVPFNEDIYTYSDFRHIINNYPRSIKEIMNLAKRFIAVANQGGFYVKVDNDHNFQYVEVSEKKLKEAFNMNIRVKTQEGEVQVPLSKILLDAINMRMLNSYRYMKLFSSSTDTLATYRPPVKTRYDRKIVDKWIDLIKTFIVSPAPFIELLDSMATRLRNDKEPIAKFFINYGPGNTGKTFMVSNLSRICPFNCNVQVDQHQVENDKHNAWLEGKILVWLEEVESSTYQTHALDRLLKIWSGDKLSVRPLYGNTKVIDNLAIYGMNTNSNDLYGLINADTPVINRLVITEFKQTYSKEELDKLTRPFRYNTSFAYSLWYYLMYEHQISPNYSSNRYFGEEKYEFIRKQRASVGNSVIEWFKVNGPNFINEFKGRDGTIHVKIYEKAANESYKEFIKNRPKAKLTISQTLTNEPFHFKRVTDPTTKQGKVFRCPKDVYEKDLNLLINGNAEENEVDDDDGEYEDIDDLEVKQ